jgi:molecular chaperone IbpA
MTNTKFIHTYPRAAFLGFDHLFDQLEKVHSKANNSGYPPHNVIKESDTKFIIEVAVAGFNEQDLAVELKDGFLHITGDMGMKDAEDIAEYIHKGISSRKFSRTIRLSEHVEVNGAELKNGILVIQLENVIPEELRPVKIPINGGHNNAQTLNEGRI